MGKLMTPPPRQATRLRFIAERVPALQQDALRMLLQEATSPPSTLNPQPSTLSTLIYVVTWSEFSIVPSYPHYPQPMPSPHRSPDPLSVLERDADWRSGLGFRAQGLGSGVWGLKQGLGSRV